MFKSLSIYKKKSLTQELGMNISNYILNSYFYIFFTLVKSTEFNIWQKAKGKLKKSLTSLIAFENDGPSLTFLIDQNRTKAMDYFH